VDQDGKFRATQVYRYREAGSRYTEVQVVSGAIRGSVAAGSIRGRVKIIKAGGQVVRCSFGPQRWRLVD
jgi:hypothetical protein